MTRLAAAFLAGAFCGLVTVWPERTVQPAPEVSPARAIVTPAAPATLQLAREADAWTAGQPHRNLFAFFELPAPRRVVQDVRPAMPQRQPVAVVPQPVEPVLPPFAYRYIGSFGPRDAPFAAFARDGEVVNVRVGETIGGFTLRRIDADGVDLARNR